MKATFLIAIFGIVLYLLFLTMKTDTLKRENLKLRKDMNELFETYMQIEEMNRLKMNEHIEACNLNFEIINDNFKIIFDR
jgi:hypothetical protein